jgi:tripartite-type tricarboxylate transporter receptor subunit TctC
VNRDGEYRTQALIGRRQFFGSTILAALAAVAAVASLPHPALAQSGYPERPVRIILPFGAGGVADISARLVAEALGEKLKQRFVIENQPSAGGIAAARAVISAPADGYTLALLSNGTAISVPLFKSLPFDPIKDFVPISSIGTFECVIVTNAASDYRTLQDILKAARTNPGKLNVGTIAVGSTQHLTAELFKTMAGVDVVAVPFKTTPEAIVALLRDDVQFVIDFHAALKGGIADGKLRAVATTGASRSEALPNVPTVQEAGIGGFDVTSWNGLFAPAGTPPEAVKVVNSALRDVLSVPELKKRMLDLGISGKASSPEEVKARLVSDIEKWSKVIEKAGIPKR